MVGHSGQQWWQLWERRRSLAKHAERERQPGFQECAYAPNLGFEEFVLPGGQLTERFHP